jgi:integrase
VIPAMPRPRPQHLQRETTRHGAVVWYHRIDDGPRTRIRGEYGSPEFMAAYQAAENGTPLEPPAKPGKGSLKWLIDQYRDAGPWLALSAATRRQRENIFEGVLKTAGMDPAAAVTAKTIKAGLERRKHTLRPRPAISSTPCAALFEWAVEAEHVPHDPTVGVKAPPRPKTDGFVAWTEDHVAAYQKRWPIGTKERVWLDVLLYTGLRRGDAVRFGRPHIRNRVGRIRTEKSGETVTAIVPILSVLERTLKAGPVGDLTFIVGEFGRPLTKESFGNLFREACKLAKVPGSAHGVRKIAATTAANNGATVAQLKALFGWTDDAMPALYTKTADRERLGDSTPAIRWRTPREHLSPHLVIRCGEDRQILSNQ